MTDLPVLILGAGGHGLVVADALLASGRQVAGFLDIDPAARGGSRLGLPVLGDDSLLSDFPAGTVALANGLGSVAMPASRRAIYLSRVAEDYEFATVLHPGAIVSPHAVLGQGVQVMAGAVIQPEARIGDNVLVNTRASVDHGCDIGSHSHLAPGCILSGDVRLGQNCHVGSGAVIIQGIELGHGTVVGAGAVVIGDHGPHATLIGVPARMTGPR